ncbi:MAG: DUF4349 domain-containing protein [Candidatus Methanoperedens sp.]|nr:DUF4349 domain-containing protein [Candidatus Methanoperedens sp.]
MKSKTLVIFSILLLVIAAGCLGKQETPVQEKYTSSLKSAPSLDTESVSYENKAVTPDRKIISTASLTIEVKSVQAAFDSIAKIVQANQGFISSSSTYDTAGRKNGQMTVRVPQKNFNPALEQVEVLGTVKSRQISGQDVTEEFIDLGARLGNLKKQETRLAEILKNATTVKDVLEVERELERVRGEIERLTGRLNYLNQSVEMSTISVSASEPTPIGGQGWGITDALSEAVTGFIDSIKGIIVFVGIILPVVVFIAIVYYIALAIKRKVLPKPKT